jgi:(p)ppGpp synthase/HD superfamily hydrolase
MMEYLARHTTSAIYSALTEKLFSHEEALSILDTRMYSFFLHRNQTYDGKCYLLEHVDRVVMEILKHSDVIITACEMFGCTPMEIVQATYLHDTIEDCGVTFNDIKHEFGITVAELVYAVTNGMGRNRKERAKQPYSIMATTTPCAIIIKLADRLANVKTKNVDKHSRMYLVYKGEFKEMYHMLYNESKYAISMWGKLAYLLQIDLDEFAKEPARFFLEEGD